MAAKHLQEPPSDVLTTEELQSAERCRIRKIQHEEFEEIVTLLKAGKSLPRSNKLLSFHPTLDENDVLRLGGRINLAKLPFSKHHPIVLPGSHRLTRLLIESEHVWLLHAGPTLVAASLAHDYCIIQGRRVIRSIVRGCVTCRKALPDPKPQILGQLPSD